jgi:hypothetical protein
VVKKNKINPLNVLEVRRVEFCPPYFETVVINPNYNLSKAVEEWIYENCSSRFYVGNTVELSETASFKQKIKIGFENPAELSFFMIACPLLKYNR